MSTVQCSSCCHCQRSPLAISYGKNMPEPAASRNLRWWPRYRTLKQRHRMLCSGRKICSQMEILTRAITSAQPISVDGEKVNNDIIIWWGRLIMSGSLIGRLIMPESLVLKGWTRTAHVWAFSAVQRFREKHSEYLIDASEDLRSFGCTRGLVVMDWSAPAVLVGRVEEASSSSVCWVDSVDHPCS